jgi:hypothetical protein
MKGGEGEWNETKILEHKTDWQVTVQSMRGLSEHRHGDNCFNNNPTELGASNGNSSDSYSKGTQFEYWLWRLLSWYMFRGFPQSIQENDAIISNYATSASFPILSKLLITDYSTLFSQS